MYCIELAIELERICIIKHSNAASFPIKTCFDETKNNSSLKK